MIAVDDDLLTIEISRSRGSGFIVLTGRSGYFSFENPGAAFVSAKTLNQRAVWGNRPHEWLKDILLAHNNTNAIVLTNPTPYPRCADERSTPLKIEQQRAFRRASQIGRNIGDIFTMIQGPLGTGKTSLISALIFNIV